MNIVIYTKEKCKYCNNAKQLLVDKKLPYQEYAIGLDIDREDVIEKYPEAKTVPIVVIDGEWIGGYMELVDYLTANGLML